MLPGELLDVRRIGKEFVPCFLTQADHPWLRELIEAHDRFSGRRWHELNEHLRWTRPPRQPEKRRRLASHILERLYRVAPKDAATSRRPVTARQLRERVFAKAARRPGSRDLVLAEIASELGLDANAALDALFADLPSERILVEPKAHPSPSELALRCNLAVAQGLVARSSSLTLELEGNARAVVRQAQLRGLICSVRRVGSGGGLQARAKLALDISGPYALFRRTRLYGRALAELVPLLAWSRRFRLVATSHVEGRSGHVVLRTGDPIFPSVEPKLFDSKLEQRFAKDFAKAAPEWLAIREPEPLEADGHLVFPDFALVHRADERRRWLLEIVGFWTADYLREKLARYRKVDVRDLILCIDSTRACDESELPRGAVVLRYRKRIDPRTVLPIIEAE